MQSHLMTVVVIFSCLMLVWSVVSSLSAEEQGIDTSKPTNFYSFVDNTVEYNSQPNQNRYGYRGKLTWAPSEAHLVLGEIPVLYNDRTAKFGIGDIRARYFWLAYKDYSRLFGAFGPSVDVFIPTGSYEDGLGTSSWVVSPGVTGGLMVAEWIQFFPILSYQYVSEPTSNAIPESSKKERHGVTFQVITPVVFSPRFFMQITPILSRNDFDDDRSDRFALEVIGSYAIRPKLQASAYYRGNFEDDIHTGQLGLTVFL